MVLPTSVSPLFLTEQFLINMGYSLNSTSINVSNRQLTGIDQYAFANFKSIQSLDLSHNSLNSLNPSVFKGLKALKDLRYILHNKIEHSENGYF